MNLDELYLKSSYESGEDNLVQDFYIPVLGCAISYDRIAGFFSSSSLAIASRGIAGLIKNGGRMRLLASPHLNKDDYEVIKAVNKSPEAYVAKKLLFEVNNIESDFQADHLKALGWMLANHFLSIKLVQVKSLLGIENDNAIFHEKVGIIRDVCGNTLTFSGSVNETAAAWVHNVEEFKVFKDWEPGQGGFVESDIKKFQEYWEGIRPNVEVFDLPTAVEKELVEYGTDFEPKDFIDKYYNKAKKNFRTCETTKNDEYGSSVTACDKLALFPYQRDAVKKWEEHNYKLLFEMATGTGKTRTAIGCLCRLLGGEKGERLITIIATPQSTLTRQWRDEISKIGLRFDAELFADSSNKSWLKDLKMSLQQWKCGTLSKIIIYTTHTTASSQKFVDTMATFSNEAGICFVGDEAHGLGASKTRRALLPGYKYRIGLSATPRRWFDDAGSMVLTKYFGDDPFTFTISQALQTINPLTRKPFLVEYYYYPVFVQMTEDEIAEYAQLSEKVKRLGRFANRSKDDENYQKLLENLLFKRADIQKNAANKLLKLEAVLDDLEKNGSVNNCLLFVSPEQIDETLRILTSRGIVAHRFTEKEGTRPLPKYGGLTQRQYLIQCFKEKTYNALVAISCLDEGIDIPSADTAIIMSSSTNPREYVQRIGRVIRQAPNKGQARIYDFVIEPSYDKNLSKQLIEFEVSVFKKELNRVSDMSANALNNAVVQAIIDEKVRGTLRYGNE